MAQWIYNVDIERWFATFTDQTGSKVRAYLHQTPDGRWQLYTPWNNMRTMHQTDLLAMEAAPLQVRHAPSRRGLERIRQVAA